MVELIERNLTMGADIHAYVEYADFQTAEGEDYWKALTENFGSRNYYLFGLLAEVRGEGPALFPVRGLPEGRLSYQTDDGYWLRATDDPSLRDHEGWTSRSSAERYAAQYHCPVERNADGSILRVAHPDWHSHSWLATEELAAVLDHYAANVSARYADDRPNEAPVEWRAILAAMRVFEAAGKKARVVFWFDN
jgi:hypothetical protein